MITLYTFGPAFGLPDPSPFVTKAEIFLKMAGLAYRTDTSGFSKAPKGKLPYIEDAGMRIGDLTFIRFHIEEKYQFDFDRGLTAEQRAVAWAFEKMVEEQLYFALVDFALDERCQFREGPDHVLPRCAGAGAAVHRGDDPPKGPPGAARTGHRPAYARRNCATRNAGIDAVAIHLGSNAFFMGEEFPASTPRCFHSSPARCVRSSRRLCARRRNVTTTCATMSVA